MTPELSIAIGVVGISLGGSLLMWWISARRTAARLAALEHRLTHLTAGIALLTDTTEGGLRDIAVEVGRFAPAAPAAKPRRAATQRRIAGAARRGRSVQEIAATENVSEGEVRLRLNLDNQSLAHASVR
jgi:hypothetical protein